MFNIKSGFTLAELLIVISIITTLVVASLVGSISVSDKARAEQMARKMQIIKEAWISYASDVGGTCENENNFNVDNSELSCPDADDPILTSTDLYINKIGKTGWQGPYITEKEAQDLFGYHFSYDNDGDIYTSNNIKGGVNITLEWCANDKRKGIYTKIAPLIDRILDGEVDQNKGNFRWSSPTTGAGEYYYLLSPNGSVACPN